MHAGHEPCGGYAKQLYCRGELNTLFFQIIIPNPFRLIDIKIVYKVIKKWKSKVVGGLATIIDNSLSEHPI